MVRKDMRINDLLNGRSFEQVSPIELRPQAEIHHGSINPADYDSKTQIGKWNRS
jgi:hypothetical protein